MLLALLTFALHVLVGGGLLPCADPVTGSHPRDVRYLRRKTTLPRRMEWRLLWVFVVAVVVDSRCRPG